MKKATFEITLLSLALVLVISGVTCASENNDPTTGELKMFGTTPSNNSDKNAKLVDTTHENLTTDIEDNVTSNPAIKAISPPHANNEELQQPETAPAAVEQNEPAVAHELPVSPAPHESIAETHEVVAPMINPHENLTMPDDMHHQPVAAPEEEIHHEIHWSYSDDGAPVYWGDISNEFSTCSSGRSQSPIDVSTATITSLDPIDIHYSDSNLTIINNGHTIQVNYDGGSFIVVDGKRYNLLQFHFHSPSEHTVGGKQYPMVAHLVHQADDGQLGVIGVLLSVGRANALMDKLWENMPTSAGQTISVADVSINARNLLPKDLTYFNYSGSLTTPPCSENVNWMLLTSPSQVADDQIEYYQTFYQGNARPVQAINGRVIRLSN